MIVTEADFDDLMPFPAKRFEKTLFMLFALALDQIDVGIGNDRARALTECDGKVELG